MNKQFKLVIDIDGVACAHADAICKQVNQDFSLSSTAGDVVSWDHSFGEISFVKAVERYYPIKGFVLSMGVTPGFEGFLQEISTISDVSFATARTDARDDTLAWIRKNFGDGYRVQFTDSKEVVDAHAVIDDSEKTVIRVAEKNKLAILFTQPWNDHSNVDSLLSELPLAKRARGFGDVLSILKEYRSTLA